MGNRTILYIFLYFTPLTLNAEIVDFDGKTKGNADVTNFLLEYRQDTPVTPTRISEDSSQSILKIGVVAESGDFVEVQPDKNWFNEEGIKVDHYTFLPGAKIWNEVTCTWRNSRSWSAEVSYYYIHDLYGGHHHYSLLPPALYISRNYSNTPPDNTFAPASSPIIVPQTADHTPYKFWIKLPEFATRINLETQSYGSCAGQYKSAVADVKYTDAGGKELQAMPEKGKNYILYNSTTAASYHPDSHYGTKEFIDALTSIADDYWAVCPGPKAKPLYINDMSLPWGGKFDLNLKWTTGSHTEHQKGINADVSKKLVRKANRAKLLEIMCKKFNVGSEGNKPSEAPHYHLALKTGNSALDEDFFALVATDPKFIDCCPVPDPIPEDWGCIKLQQGGSNYAEVELPETPTDCK